MVLEDNHLYEFEPFVLDARNRLLLKDGATVRLAPKAFETLLVLVQHAMQVVDKEQLLKTVWRDTFVEEGNLTYNISGLRKALSWWSNHQVTLGEEEYLKSTMAFSSPSNLCSSNSEPARCRRPLKTNSASARMRSR